MAKLYFRYGAMNCGKTTAMIQVAFNYEERGMQVLVIKPKVDTKGEDTIVSRLGITRRVDILVNKHDDLYRELTARRKSEAGLHCVLVDEAQFLTSKQVAQLFNVAITLDVPVLCYGLRADFQGKAFPGSSRLFELAHSIEELKTICRCGKKALMNGRKVNGTFVAQGSQVAIDGQADVSYESLCGGCYVRQVGPIV